MPFLDTSGQLIVNIVDSLKKLLIRSKIRVDLPFIQWEINTTSSSIDDRLSKLNDAKAALESGLQAIGELKVDATRHKSEVRSALEKLAQLTRETKVLEGQKEEIAEVLDSNISAFRMAVGIPSKAEQNKDKILGFISGVLASLVAAALIYGGTEGYKYYKMRAEAKTQSLEDKAL